MFTFFIFRKPVISLVEKQLLEQHISQILQKGECVSEKGCRCFHKYLYE